MLERRIREVMGAVGGIEVTDDGDPRARAGQIVPFRIQSVSQGRRAAVTWGATYTLAVCRTTGAKLSIRSRLSARLSLRKSKTISLTPRRANAAMSSAT